MSDNLALWRSVEKTHPDYVKPITGKQYQGTSPSPHWLRMRLTETFGPAGIGWGTKVLRQDFIQSGDKMAHYLTLQLWYVQGGVRGEVEAIGGTEIAGTRQSGKAFIDEDGPKKSMTDAFVKAAAELGFCADIFLGRWDDSKYVRERKQEVAAAERLAGQKTTSRTLGNGGLPVIAPDGRLHEITDDGDQPAVMRWMKACRKAIAQMEDAPALHAWRREMGPLFGSISEKEPEAVAAVEQAIQARLEAFMSEPEMEDA